MKKILSVIFKLAWNTLKYTFLLVDHLVEDLVEIADSFVGDFFVFILKSN